MGDRGPPSKRYRRDDNVDPTNPDPSIVVHVRNLSGKATEADLLEALSHFGSISYATCMPNKRMALVEFEELEGARACVVYAQTNQIYVAGQAALFNYSTSKMIQRLGLESEVPNIVLIITIYNVQYPMNVEVIHQICKSHGEVRRIAMIRRSLLQALVEFDSVDSAKKAKHAMNGADIYSGCCTLKVEFAKPPSVKVSRNDQDQWDFVTPPDQLQGGNEGYGRRALLGPAQDPMAPGMPMQMARGGGGGGGGGGAGFGGMGPMDQGGYGPPMGRMGPPGGGGGGGGFGGGGGGGGGYGGGGRGDDRFRGDDRARGGGDDEPSSVVMVYGIDQAKINCDKLFNLMCLYGNCLKIKFMKSKPDTSMVQMGNQSEVFCAIDHLHGFNLFGQQLALRPSKQKTLHDIRDPFDMPDGTPSFKDYTGSRNQRFSTAESAQRNRIVKPTNVLHWYNAPATMTEEQMQQILSEAQAATPTKVSIFPVRSERSSAGVVEFETTDAATDALVLANHTPVDSPVGKIPYILKLAFAGGRDGREYR